MKKPMKWVWQSCQPGSRDLKIPNVFSPRCPNSDGSIQVEQGTLYTYLQGEFKGIHPGLSEWVWEVSEPCPLQEDITKFCVSLRERHSRMHTHILCEDDSFVDPCRIFRLLLEQASRASS